MASGKELRMGHYDSLVLANGKEWKDVLVVWAKVQSTRSIRLSIEPVANE